MTVGRRRLAAAWSAAVAAPVLWAATTQLGQVMPYADCADGNRWTAITALIAAAIALLAAGICWRNRLFSRQGRFASAVGSLLALVLAFAILLQTLAGFMLSGCER